MMTDAVVRKIDPAKGLVVLKHGDKVRFHVEIVKGKPTVTQLETAR